MFFGRASSPAALASLAASPTGAGQQPVTLRVGRRQSHAGSLCSGQCADLCLLDRRAGDREHPTQPAQPPEGGGTSARTSRSNPGQPTGPRAHGPPGQLSSCHPRQHDRQQHNHQARCCFSVDRRQVSTAYGPCTLGASASDGRLVSSSLLRHVSAPGQAEGGKWDTSACASATPKEAFGYPNRPAGLMTTQVCCLPIPGRHRLLHPVG